MTWTLLRWAGQDSEAWGPLWPLVTRHQTLVTHWPLVSGATAMMLYLLLLAGKLSILSWFCPICDDNFSGAGHGLVPTSLYPGCLNNPRIMTGKGEGVMTDDVENIGTYSRWSWQLPHLLSVWDQSSPHVLWRYDVQYWHASGFISKPKHI